MRNFWLFVVALVCTFGLAARVTGRVIYTGVMRAGGFTGALLAIATFVATVLHVANHLGVPVPDPLPFLPSSLSN